MFVLHVLAPLLVVTAAWLGLRRFDGYSERRFRHRFLSRHVLLAFFVLGCLLALGRVWWASGVRHAADPWNGIILMILGSAGALALFALNLRRTSIIVGLTLDSPG
jgi:hypothetical protein